MSTTGAQNKAKGEEVRKALPLVMHNDGLQAEQCARLIDESIKLQKEVEEMKKKIGQQSTVRKTKTESEPKKDVKKLESDLEKAKKENGSLKKELEECRFDLVTLQKNFNYEEVRKALPLVMDNDGLQAEQCARLTDEINKLQEKVEEMKKKIGMKELQAENEKLKTKLKEYENDMTRLSELASAQLMTNNPNAAELSDSNRPTKLAQQYSELYDNEWTNAYEFLEKTGLSEVKITQNLRGILVNSFKFCTDVSREQTNQLKLVLTTVPRVKNGEPISDDSIIPTKLQQLRELRKAFAPDMIDDVFQSYKKEKKPKDIDKVQVRDYTHKCITLSWFMSVQDPPVVIDTENHTGNFDSDIFRKYTKTGALIDHVVWPPLYLHDGGPILCKGVAQAK